MTSIASVVVSYVCHNMNIWKEIIHILQIVMEQNYCPFDQLYCKQIDGLAMGAPILILAETFIQHMEHKHICPIFIVCILLHECN
jgi:hypothetical protein